MLEQLWNLDDAAHFVNFIALAFLLEALVLLWIGKWIKDLVSPFSINDQLTHEDNKALAVSYTGYMVAQGIIIHGVFQGEFHDLTTDLIGVAIWSLIGIVLLNLSTWINNQFILRRFDNVKEIIEDRNVGTGAVQCGTYLGTAFIIRAVIQGESSGWTEDLIMVGLFFLVGQLCFVLFSFVYQGITAYDVHDEIEKDNVAAGVSFGLTLTAVGIILSHSLETTHSLAALGVWFFNGVVLLVISRFLVDKLILASHKLDSEIATDRNWGAALVEGGGALIVAVLLNASFA